MNIIYFNRIVGIFAAVAALLISANAFAASDFLLEIEGIKGECKGKKFTLTENKDGSFTITDIPAGTYKLIAVPWQGTNPEVPHETYGGRSKSISLKFEGVISPRDVGSGMASGKRQHKPFTITKELDKMSPKGTSLGEIVVGDLDGDGMDDRAQGDPIHGVDVKLGTKSKVNQTNPPENAGKAPAKTGYDLKLNKKV